MTKRQSNTIFEAIAKAIENKYDVRIVIEFENGDEMLVDFSNTGEPFETDAIAIYSLQRPIHDENSKWQGTEEIDCGSYTQYSELYDFIIRTMNQTPVQLYIDSF